MGEHAAGGVDVAGRGSRVPGRVEWEIRLGVRFADDGLEAEFRRDFNAAALTQVRWAGALAILLYAAFGALDVVIAPDDAVPLLVLRAVVIAWIAAVLWLSFRLAPERLDRLQQPLICSVAVLAAAGLDAMPLVADVPSSYASTGTLLILMFLFGFARVRFPPAALATVLMIVVYEVSEIAQDVSFTTTLYNNFFLLGFIVVGVATCLALERLRRREFLYEEALRGAFGSYVSADLIDRVATGDAVIAGEDVEVTVLFADIRGFTTFAARSTARETVAFLNDFYAAVLPIVRAHGGHANKLLGDGLLAVFGAPVALTDHADRAVAAALEMVRTVADAHDDSLQIGIGISSGVVVAGTIGDPGKLDYTLIGDTVNVAARVEQLTKQTGDPILMTEGTAQLLGRPWALMSRGEHVLRGRTQPTQLHAITAPSGVGPAGALEEDPVTA